MYVSKNVTIIILIQIIRIIIVFSILGGKRCTILMMNFIEKKQNMNQKKILSEKSTILIFIVIKNNYFENTTFFHKKQTKTTSQNKSKKKEKLKKIRLTVANIFTRLIREKKPFGVPPGPKRSMAPSSSNESWLENWSTIERTSFMKHELFPILWNSDVTKQLRRHQIPTIVSLNGTNIQQRFFWWIYAMLETHLVASFKNVLKPLLVREFSPSGLLKCFPQFWNLRIPMNSAVTCSFILIITTYQFHDQFRDFGWKRVFIEGSAGRNIIPLLFFNRNNFFRIVHWIRSNFRLLRMSFLNAGLLLLCRTRFTFFCNRSFQKSFRTRGIVSEMQLIHIAILPSANHNPRGAIWRCRGWKVNFNSMSAKILCDMNLMNWSNFCSFWNCCINSGIRNSTKTPKPSTSAIILKHVPRETLFPVRGIKQRGRSRSAECRCPIKQGAKHDMCAWGWLIWDKTKMQLMRLGHARAKFASARRARCGVLFTPSQRLQGNRHFSWTKLLEKTLMFFPFWGTTPRGWPFPFCPSRSQ